MRVNVPISAAAWTRFFSRWDILAFLLILGLLVFLAEASRHLFEPLAELQRQPPSLDPRNLPEYAARTTLRMLIAMVASLLFTFTYATLAAKSRTAERLLIPLLDIFTSQAWNMAFSFYQSLRTIPAELEEASRNFRLSPWMRFWRLDVPFAMPQLIWNMMMSMSGSWFFVVASEAISVGNTTITLPGIGSYIALAIERRDLVAVCWAIGAMLIVIFIYDQVLFRPLVAWADRFRFEQEPGTQAPESWVFDVLRRSRLIERLIAPFAALWRQTLRPRHPEKYVPAAQAAANMQGRFAFQVGLIVVALAAVALWQTVSFAIEGITMSDVATTLVLGLATLTRVVVLIALASVIWVPIGVWVGVRPRVANLIQPLAQFLAAFPANLLFPIVVSIIVAWKLSPNIWLSPLMILGTQWYILFNVIAGAAAIPNELRAVGVNLRVRGWLWWRRIALPAVLPYYVTGAITASGGSWNASIVAEVASWGDEHLQADGLGAYIAQQTDAGDFHRIVLGIAVMSLFVVVINRLFWRPLYFYAERKFRLG